MPSLDAVVLALGHGLVLGRVDLLPGRVERVVGRRVAAGESVRVFSKEHKHGRDGAVDHGHDHVRDRVADEKAAEPERRLGVGHVDGPLRVAVHDRAHACGRAHKAHDDLPEEQHVDDERVVGDGRPALGRKELPHALAGRDEAVAVDAHVRVGKAVEVLDPPLDAAHETLDAAEQTGRDGVALLGQRLLEGPQNDADGLDDGHDERAKADGAERQRERPRECAYRRERTPLGARVVPPARDRAGGRDHDNVAADERAPEEDDEHADEDAELLRGRVVRALFNVLAVVDGGVRGDDPHERPRDLHERKDDGRDEDDGVAQYGLARDLEVGRRERDARADAAHVEQHERREERSHGDGPPVHRVALLAQKGGRDKAGTDRDGADGADGDPDEHLAAEQHDDGPEQRRHGRAGADYGADLERVLVFGVLLADEVGELLNLLLVGRAREHVLAVDDRERDGRAERHDEDGREENVVAGRLRLGLRRQHGRLGGLAAVGIGLELLGVVLVLLAHGVASLLPSRGMARRVKPKGDGPTRWEFGRRCNRQRAT